MNKVKFGQYEVNLSDEEYLVEKQNWGITIGDEPDFIQLRDDTTIYAVFALDKPREPYTVKLPIQYKNLNGKNGRKLLEVVINIQESNNKIGFGDSVKLYERTL